MNDLLIVIGTTLEEWRRVRWEDLRLAEHEIAVLTLAVLLAIALLVILVRGLSTRRPGRSHVAVPALLPVFRRPWLSATRHGAFFLFLVGVPFFAVALADPSIALTREEVSYPGRRIALMIDASSSMLVPFNSTTLNEAGTATFFTAVSAADHFMKLRMKGPYRDLISLIEFGNEAYVITPFTSDYQNILLSITLIGNSAEWRRFPDPGTIITQAIHQGVQLFRTFDFLDASGNLMVIFSDGQDTLAASEGLSLDDILAEAREADIPIYFIRTAFNRKLGGVLPDELWKSAVERTGGRFYPASDEDSILRAMREIDRLAAGRIDVREYTADRPRFAGFTVIAVALWLAAGFLKLGSRHFTTFP